MKNFLSCVALLFVTQIYAQSPVIEWQRALGGSAVEVAQFMNSTSDGGYIVVGYSDSNDGDVSGNHGDLDYWIVKLDNDGNLQWQRSLGGSGEEIPTSIQQTSDGGYITAGFTTSNDGDVSGNHGGSDAWVIKLDNAGSIQWEKSLGGSGDDIASSIQQTSDGGYIISGTTESNDGDVSGNHGSFDYWIVKLDNAGDIQWQKSLGGSADDSAAPIQQTSDGGYITAGNSNSNDGDVSGNHGNADYWIVKLDNTGAVQWQKSLGGTGEDVATSIQQTSDGGYIAAGYTYSNNGDVSGNHGASDYWAVKLDATGNIQWQKCLGGSGYDIASSIQQTLDGGYIVAGYSTSNDGDVSGNHGIYDYWIVKLDNTGVIQWQQSYGGTGMDLATAVLQTDDGGYIIAGASMSNDGDVSGNHGDGDFWIVKLLAETAGTDEMNTPNRFIIYPNPVTDWLTVKSISPKTKIVITNMLGETVLRTVANGNELTIDVSKLPTGVYFVNGQKFIKK